MKVTIKASELRVGDSFQVKYDQRWSNNFRVSAITDVSEYLKRPVLMIDRMVGKTMLLEADTVVKVWRDEA